MKILAARNIDKLIDRKFSSEQSIVLRYRNAFSCSMSEEEDSKYKELLQETSIREGARGLSFIDYKGVEIHLVDETSLMHTNTIKSIDGCVTIARCLLKGCSKVIFESGGNTGMALTEYGQKAGLETFCFLPAENIPLLNSKVFKPKKAHLLSVDEPGMVKQAAHLFSRLNNIEHIPQPAWRHEASMFRGFFILEYLLGNGKFDWISQTISAAFGPIGIYLVLNNFYNGKEKLPRFLGVQQEANCPMYKAWRSKKLKLEPDEIRSTSGLLTKVMYDVKPHTYGTYEDLTGLLMQSDGDISTINHAEFDNFVEQNIDGSNILGLLKKKEIPITVKNGEVLEKTGLIALAGTFKEIDSGKIAKGSRVLCCLTSGVSQADGLAQAEYRFPSLDFLVREYSKLI
jgi:hypothetical protein